MCSRARLASAIPLHSGTLCHHCDPLSSDLRTNRLLGVPILFMVVALLVFLASLVFDCRNFPRLCLHLFALLDALRQWLVTRPMGFRRQTLLAGRGRDLSPLPRALRI